MPGVYCFEDRKTHKKYIGQSSNVERRIKEHIKKLKNNEDNAPKLQEAYNNNSKFNIFILQYEPNFQRRVALEQYYINKYDTINNGLNTLTSCSDGRIERIASMYNITVPV